MRVVHDPADRARVLATDAETAETAVEQLRGLMGRSSLPDDYALVFPFEDPPVWIPDAIGEWRSIHMLFVRVPLDVLWLADDEVRAVETLQPWRGLGWARADTVVEHPAGAADGVDVGDTVVVEDG